MSFLDRIRPLKEAEAELLRREYTVNQPVRPDHLKIRDFGAAISGGGKLIGEVKHKSPSNPDFRMDIAPGRLAAVYRRHGASALSIVTDEANFGTSLADIASLHEAVDLPVIAKDFIIDPVQIRAAWAAGADAVLLIARMLDRTLMERLMEVATSLGLSALVECHDEADIDMAVAVGARLIGVNNRNLATLTTDLQHGGQLLPLIPAGVTRVSESGLNFRSDIETMAGLGADAFLVGHALLLSRDPGRKVGELTGRLAEEGTRVKVCGITNVEDAVTAAGADILGVIFAESPRKVDAERAVEIRRAVADVRLCGVFMDQDADEVCTLALECELDLIQLHGSESPEYCREVGIRAGLPVIKAMRPDEVTPDSLTAYETMAYFLVDLPKGPPGGPGPEAATRAAELIRQSGREVFLAGALNLKNVGAAIASAQPFAVDVSSGVEKSPGIKDTGLVEAFIKEARS